MMKAEAREKNEEYNKNGQYLCSEAIFLVANEHFGPPVPDSFVKVASGFFVGIGGRMCVRGVNRGEFWRLASNWGVKRQA
jgi:hypothetical protein